VARENHVAIDVDVEYATRGSFQLHVRLAALFKFRLDTQGLGFVASSATVFDENRHLASFCLAQSSAHCRFVTARRRPKMVRHPQQE
jgi:hypothetical protein